VLDVNCSRCSVALPAGARFCPRCGTAVGLPSMDERKLVTVLFADITGSTSLGERFDPERWGLTRFRRATASSNR